MDNARDIHCTYILVEHLENAMLKGRYQDSVNDVDQKKLTACLVNQNRL